MSKTATITLGDQNYEVGPLTLAQLREIGVGSAELLGPQGTTPAEIETEWYNSTFKIIGVAIGKTSEEIEQLEGVVRPQLLDAQRTIWLLSGIVKEKTEEGVKDRPPGEGPGAATG